MYQYRFFLLLSDLRNYRVGTASCNRRKITSGVGRHYYIIIIRIPTEHPPPLHILRLTPHAGITTHTRPHQKENANRPHHRRLKYRHRHDMLYIIIYDVRSRGTAASTPVASFLPQTTRRPYYWRGRHHYCSHVNLIIYARP